MAEIVWQRAEQGHIADRRRPRGRRVDGAQHAVALAEVQGDVGDAGEQLAGLHDTHAGVAQRGLVLTQERLLRVAGGVVGELLAGESHRRLHELEGPP